MSRWSRYISRSLVRRIILRLALIGAIMLIGLITAFTIFATVVGFATMSFVFGVMSVIAMIVALAFIYPIYRGVTPMGVVTGLLPRFIARTGYSVRWKFLASIFLIVLIFFLVSFSGFFAMDFMHEELHDIQELKSIRLFDVLDAVDDLEETSHGLFFTLTPFLGAFGTLLALGLGASMAWSVIDPVRRMERAMRRIASGDFSQSVQVDNRDELGELATRINQTAQELARHQEATLAEERSRALQERIVQVTLAQEEERRRISRELHDGLGPSLASQALKLDAALELLRSNSEAASTLLEGMKTQVQATVADVRRLVYNLRPQALDQVGLVAALRGYTSGTDGDADIPRGLRIVVEVPEQDLPPLPAAVEVAAYRIALEAMTNTARHGQAQNCVIRFSLDDAPERARMLQLEITDDGRGLPENYRIGVGLNSMRERAEELGGTWEIGPSSNRGTHVLARLPLARET